MTLRSILATALAGLVLSSSIVATADAATARRRTTHMTRARGTAPAAAPMRRGGDAQNAAVDRLNEQSLAAARGTGAAPAPAAPMTPMTPMTPR